jgi:hypothetical protein
MPKGTTNEDRAKVKFRVIEFELEGGNANVENSIRQLAHAFTNHGSGGPARVATPRPPKELSAGAPAEDIDEVAGEAEYIEPTDVEIGAPPTKPAKPRTAYKPRTPLYIHDLDLTGKAGTTFKAFAAQKSPKRGTERYLVAAFWLKEHGNSPTINIDKAYTCYRTVDWPTNQSDWDMNLRTQVKTDRFRRVNPGEYAITPKGEDVVREMDGTQ